MGRTKKKDNKYDCDYQNAYISLVKKQYPVTAKFLREFGVNIENPFKVNLLETKDDIIYYSEILYIVLGDKTKFKKAKIGKVKIEIADSYPDTNIKENHYVIKLSPIEIQNKLKVEDDKGKKEIFKTIMSKCTYQAIMFIICGLIALWGILTTSLVYGIKLYLEMLLVLIIPVIVFAIALYRKYKYRIYKKARSNINWFTTFALLLLPIYYFFTLFILGFESATTDVTNYKFYKDFMYGELYEVFPKKIPKNAEIFERINNFFVSMSFRTAASSMDRILSIVRITMPSVIRIAAASTPFPPFVAQKVFREKVWYSYEIISITFI